MIFSLEMSETIIGNSVLTRSFVSHALKKAVITVKGATGALLGAFAGMPESFESIYAAILRAVPEEHRDRVEGIFSDTPAVLYSQISVLRSAFKGLRAVGEDVVHGMIRLTQHSGGTQNQAARLLQRVNIATFMGTNEEAGFVEKVGDPEQKCLEAYQTWLAKLDEEGAKKVVADAGACTPAAYGKALAAVAVLCRSDWARKDGKGRKLIDCLQANTTHFGFLRNTALLRGSLTKERRRAMPLGTTSNEAVHRETRTQFSGIYKQSFSLFEAKLRIFVFTRMGAAVVRTRSYRRAEQQETLAQIAGQIGRLKCVVLGPITRAARELDAEQRRGEARLKQQRQALRRNYEKMRGIFFRPPAGEQARAVKRAQQARSFGKRRNRKIRGQATGKKASGDKCQPTGPASQAKRPSRPTKPTSHAKRPIYPERTLRFAEDSAQGRTRDCGVNTTSDELASRAEQKTPPEQTDAAAKAKAARKKELAKKRSQKYRDRKKLEQAPDQGDGGQ